MLQEEIGTIITEHKHIGLAATFRALWDTLPKKIKEKE